MNPTKEPEMARTPQIKIEEVTDLSEQDQSAYGQLFVAKVGDFTSAPRSTEERARSEAEAYLASQAAPGPADDEA